MPKSVKSKEILGANVRRCRESMNLSQSQLAKATKLRDQTTIGRIERGTVSTTLDTLDAIASVLGVEAWQLLIEDVDYKNPPILQTPTKAERELWEKIRESAKQLGLQ